LLPHSTIADPDLVEAWGVAERQRRAAAAKHVAARQRWKL
jgi:hypothetical protein